MPLDDTTKARVRKHMGYPQVALAPSIQFGIPKPMPMAFLLESAMENILGEAIPRVMELLEVLDATEQKMLDAQCQLAADKLGEINLAGSMDSQSRLVTDRFEDEYARWAKRLADVFGAPLYPFSERFKTTQQKRGRMIPVRRN